MSTITVRPYGRKPFEIDSFKPDRIVACNAKCHEMLGLKKEAVAPWVHVAVKIIPNGPVYNIYFVAYVWDTRQVIDEGFSHHTWAERPKLASLGRPAVDNGQPLKGCKINVLYSAVEQYNNNASIEAEGFRLKVKGVPGEYATDKVFATKEEAKAYAEHSKFANYVSIVKNRDTPTKSELQREERQKRAQERRAKRDAKPEPRRKKPTYEDWADSQAAGKMFKEIRSQLDITPDANFPSKTSFIKWVDSMWDKLTEE